MNMSQEIEILIFDNVSISMISNNNGEKNIPNCMYLFVNVPNIYLTKKNKIQQHSNIQIKNFFKNFA